MFSKRRVFVLFCFLFDRQFTIKVKQFCFLFYPLPLYLFSPLISRNHFSVILFLPPNNSVQSPRFFSNSHLQSEVIPPNLSHTHTNPGRKRNHALQSSLRRITHVREMHVDVKWIGMQTGREMDHRALFEKGDQAKRPGSHQTELIVHGKKETELRLTMCMPSESLH